MNFSGKKITKNLQKGIIIFKSTLAHRYYHKYNNNYAIRFISNFAIRFISNFAINFIIELPSILPIISSSTLQHLASILALILRQF